MALRELINQKSWLAYVLVGLLMLAAAGTYLYYRAGQPVPRTLYHKAFYSVDDGKSWFVDSTERRSSFEKDGKRAHRAYVWRGTDGKEFVSYLEREVAAKPKDGHAAPPGAKLNTSYATGNREVKKPGAAETAWVAISTPKGLEIASAPAGAEPVEPQE